MSRKLYNLLCRKVNYAWILLKVFFLYSQFRVLFYLTSSPKTKGISFPELRNLPKKYNNRFSLKLDPNFWGDLKAFRTDMDRNKPFCFVCFCVICGTGYIWFISDSNLLTHILLKLLVLIVSKKFFVWRWFHTQQYEIFYGTTKTTSLHIFILRSDFVPLIKAGITVVSYF